MADGGDRLILRLADGVAELTATAWDACAGGANPFLSHAFFSALEASGSASARTGWRPCHLVAEGAGDEIVAVAPMYLKSHSYGEYVFDHGWARAYERAGGKYYPKLQLAVPFTPVPGRRLLLRDPSDQAIEAAMIAGLSQIAEQMGVSSVHVTFLTPAETERFRDAGWLIREGYQFHWENRGYRSFDEFLAALSHGRRKSIRSERKAVAQQGLSLEVLSGPAIERRHWDAFFRFYIATSDRKWGAPYLTRDFFYRLGKSLGERVVLVLARHEDAYVAGALNLIGDDTLYGRNWGSAGEFRFLHFEACYYQAIEIAIARGLARVEAGAQGEHKLQRGYLPVPTYSAHWIADPALREAIARYLEQETPAIAAEREALQQYSPFRQAPAA